MLRPASLLPAQIRSTDNLAKGGWTDPKPDGPGAWYRKVCTDAAGQSTGTTIWIPDRVVDPRALAEQAADRVPMPLPDAHLNPPEDREQVVNLQTWLWVDSAQWHPLTAAASAGAVTVTATATPQSVTWAMGNGDTVTCQGPGTAYDYGRPSSQQSTNCGYTYRHSSASQPAGAFTVRATVDWNVTWTASGIAGGGNLGSATRTNSLTVRVAEIQAVNR